MYEEQQNDETPEILSIDHEIEIAFGSFEEYCEQMAETRENKELN